MHLTKQQRRDLACATPGTLDATIEQIKEQNPRAFHIDETLGTRVFFDQPVRNEPCKGFIRFAVKPALVG